MIWLFFWLFCSIVSAAIASSKGRSAAGWFVLGLIVGPFAFAVALMPNLKEQKAKEVTESDSRKCPFCAELIKKDAVKCRFCSSDIPAFIEEPAAGSQCPTCDYVFTGEFGKEGWWCPKCVKKNSK